MNSIKVTKASGEKEVFDESKLRSSLKGAGASKNLIDSIVTTVKETLFEGISTREIYTEAFRMLHAKSNPAAGRYKLKEAILELGPTGFPFEKFVGELLNRMGYETEVGTIVNGDCVSHEIDVIAQKEKEHYMIECKFHNRKGLNCNVKVPLYIQSRFLDVKKNWMSLPGHQGKIHRGWVVTNTRFTEDAKNYAECVGLKLLSWDYPKRNGLKDLIEKVNLHPVTCLSTLTDVEKQQLLEMDIIFCRQLCEDEKILSRIGIDSRKANRIIKEARGISDFNIVES